MTEGPGAFICAPAGPVLSKDEIRFFRDAAPWGFILFARNVETPGQVRNLTSALREAVGREAPILIDQEGGRVQRFKPPLVPQYPSGADLGALYLANRDAGLRAMAVAIDGEVMANAEYEPIGPESEIYFLTAISGG